MIRGIPRNTEFKDLFVELVKLYKPKVYMELGTKKGYIFNAVAPLVKRAIAIDCNGFPESVLSHANTLHLKMTTDEAAVLLADSKYESLNVDFLFIDADHAYKQAIKDFNSFSPHVKEGTGLIFLHDTCPIMTALAVPGYCGTAFKAAWEIRTNPKYKEFFEIVTLPGPWFGLSIIRKAKKQLLWE